jgi:hypothetical protein
LWLGNLLKWAGASSPLLCFNKAEVEVVETTETVDEAAEVVLPDSVLVE